MVSRFSSLMLICAALAGCDAPQGSEQADDAALGGKADDVDAEDGPIRIHVEAKYDCGEMGDDEPVDDDTLVFDEDEFAYLMSIDVEVPESCAEEHSTDCRVRLPSECWRATVNIALGSVSIDAFAGDADSTAFARLPLSALTDDPGDIEFDVGPDNAGGSFGNFQVSFSR